MTIVSHKGRVRPNYKTTSSDKGKVVPIHAMKAYRGSGGIAPFLFKLSWLEVGTMHHTPAIFPHGDEHSVPFLPPHSLAAID